MRDFFVYAAAVSLAVGGLVAIGYSLFLDRSRGRRRCPKCWYAMSEAPTPRCPECGWVVQREKDFFRTRRKWKMFLAGMVTVVFAVCLSREPFFRVHGYSAAIPATIFLALLQIDDSDWLVMGMNHHCSHDMWHRLIEDRFSPEGRRQAMWNWQWRWLGRTALRKIDTDAGSRPYRWAFWMWLAWSRDSSSDPGLHADIIKRVVAALEDPDPWVRTSAAHLMFDPANVDESTSRIKTLLDHPDLEIRRGAVSGLAMAAEFSDEAHRVLLHAYHNDHADVRISIISSFLYTSREDFDIKPVLDAARRDMDCNVRLNAIIAMARFAETDDLAWEVIEEAMLSDDECIRTGGFHAISPWFRQGWANLGNVRPPHSIVSHLLRGLQDEDNDIRRHTVAIILPLDISVATLKRDAHVIEGLLKHEDSAVQDCARLLWRRLKKH